MEKAEWREHVLNREGKWREGRGGWEKEQKEDHRLAIICQEEKVEQKLFIKETRPTLMKWIVCFLPRLIHSEWNVQSKWCGTAETPPQPQSHINIPRLAIDSQTLRDQLQIHIPSTSEKKKNTIMVRNVPQKNPEYNKIVSVCLVALECQSSLCKQTKCVIDTEPLPKTKHQQREKKIIKLTSQMI